MSEQHDVISWDRRPRTSPARERSARHRSEARTAGVTIMLKGFRVGRDANGEPFAALDCQIRGAVQAVQAVRQAIALARKGRGR